MEWFGVVKDARDKLNHFVDGGVVLANLFRFTEDSVAWASAPPPEGVRLGPTPD